jgi:hypothetical protein
MKRRNYGFKSKLGVGAIVTDPVAYGLDPDWVVSYTINEDLGWITWVLKSANLRGKEMGDTHQVSLVVIRKQSDERNNS